MAGAAVIVEPALVCIVLCVTVYALTVRPGKYRGFMTCIAFEIVVFAQQWKAGQAVNE